VSDNQATSGTTASTSTQNRILHRPSTLRTGTILERRESSLLDLHGSETTERQVSLTLSTLDLTPGNGTRSHVPVASHKVNSRRGSLQFNNRHSMDSKAEETVIPGLGIRVNSSDSSSEFGSNHYGNNSPGLGKLQDDFSDTGVIGSMHQNSIVNEVSNRTRQLPKGRDGNDRRTETPADVPILDLASIAELEKQEIEMPPLEGISNILASGKQYIYLDNQHRRFDLQQPKPSYIPRPASKLQHYRGKVEIVPLSLVEDIETLTPGLTAPIESIVQKNAPDSTNTDVISPKTDTIDAPTYQQNNSNEQRQSTTAARKSTTRPQTVPLGKSKPADLTRFSTSAKPVKETGGKGSKVKTKKLHTTDLVIDTKTGKKVTILTRQGFGTTVEKKKTFGDPMEALLSSHNNPASKLQENSSSPNLQQRAETPFGPSLPHLESRPITALLKKRLRDPQTYNPTNTTRQFQADSTISPYSQPLPITRYIPNSQKQPSKHAAKLRGLRAQHEFKIQEAYLGNTAIAPKWFMRHAEQVVEEKVQQGLMFGGNVQGLVPSFNTHRPSHVVFSTLGKVHWQEYGRGGSGGGGELADFAPDTSGNALAADENPVEEEHGETRRLLDGLLKRHRIKRVGDDDSQYRTATRRVQTPAKTQQQQQQSITQNIGLLNPNPKEEKTISLGGGFIYSKNKALKEDPKPPGSSQFRARRSRYIEQLFVEAFSM
ncbi:UNVERIFIED_CONTAM: hypothetical protein HDU68_000164, partial [Siphonaria sp. JEL0065]